MKIYLDYVFFINFLFDFILLVALSIVLKHNVKIIRLILGALFGGFSIFILFFRISSLLFFVLKLILGFIMVIITFKFKDLKYTINNFFYLMILSIIMGGALYLFNISNGYSNSGLVFFTNGKKSNLLVLIIISIIVLFIYIKLSKNRKKINLYYKVDLFVGKKILSLRGFLDTGNELCDPFFKKPILIVNKDIDIKTEKSIFVPFNTIDGKGLMECFFVDKVCID